MQCSKFPERPAAGVCAYSGKPYSVEELVEVQGKMYAKDNLSHVMAEVKERQNNSNTNPMVFMNAGGAAASASAATTPSNIELAVGRKSKTTAIVLALLLGGLGFHKFYLNQPIWGILYLVFCWTFIPSIVAFFEALIYLSMSDADFSRKYG